jgi:hypothetical protein
VIRGVSHVYQADCGGSTRLAHRRSNSRENEILMKKRVTKIKSRRSLFVSIEQIE